MNSIYIERHFARMGSRFQVTRPETRRQTDSYSVNIQRDSAGDYFALRVPPEIDSDLNVAVLQVLPRDRHLLLYVHQDGKEEKDRYLCGHDERDWFVAAVPGNVSTVRDAREALKPDRVRREQLIRGVPQGHLNRRRNEAFLRQGEWFFVEEHALRVDRNRILRNEPIRRGGGKPHIVAEVFRSGGDTVYVHRLFPNGVLQEEYARIIAGNRNMPPRQWRTMMRNPAVYARGTVRHPDHKTITLPVWHQVLMNTETETRTMRSVAFLD
ncbi:MAG: hypothetical protein ACAI35_03845 [Candidatus Methylacidiphilales bacterium]|nr:hypothetical protein [Candidatus Methylacidiphilales bacterium]